MEDAANELLEASLDEPRDHTFCDKCNAQLHKLSYKQFGYRCGQCGHDGLVPPAPPVVSRNDPTTGRAFEPRSITWKLHGEKGDKNSTKTTVLAAGGVYHVQWRAAPVDKEGNALQLGENEGWIEAKKPIGGGRMIAKKHIDHTVAYQARVRARMSACSCSLSSTPLAFVTECRCPWTPWSPPSVKATPTTPDEDRADDARQLRRESKVDARKLARWRKLSGDALEPVLTSGAIAVLDAQWIISHAKAGGVLSHRQALPEEAFLSLADLVEATSEYKLPVAALSCPWLTKDHPDPRGANLSRVAKALKALLNRSLAVFPRLGVFWDYGSLHQHPDPANGVMRTEEQNALFKQGLSCLGTLYSHPKTTVLRLTSFPVGHKTEDQPEGTNVAAYFDRGWCFTEQSWASLTKSSSLSLDLGKMRDGKEYHYRSLIDDCTQSGGRRPPLLPSAFAAELEKKSFTNGKDDKPLVKRLYEAAFEEQFGKATRLYYAYLGWGDAEAAQLAEVLASGAAPRLEELVLFNNKISNEQGCKALVAVCEERGIRLH